MDKFLLIHKYFDNLCFVVRDKFRFDFTQGFFKQPQFVPHFFLLSISSVCSTFHFSCSKRETWNILIRVVRVRVRPNDLDSCSFFKVDISFSPPPCSRPSRSKIIIVTYQTPQHRRRPYRGECTRRVTWRIARRQSGRSRPPNAVTCPARANERRGTSFRLCYRAARTVSLIRQVAPRALPVDYYRGRKFNSANDSN